MSVKRIMKDVEKTLRDIKKAKARQPKKPENNYFAILDIVDSPLDLINLNVKKIPAKVANVVTTTVLKDPVAMAIDEDSMLIMGDI
ncbi:hypothetical protein [Candidatus Tisiphia endosymbiont of Sialis lutaria]|uniref:hypothetical protein n=1 Tax=Candidatus Tisiphia endosymbiont of Sialis lutaria TaxID=2029164 RepID=UPI00312CA772